MSSAASAKLLDPLGILNPRQGDLAVTLVGWTRDPARRPRPVHRGGRGAAPPRARRASRSSSAAAATRPSARSSRPRRTRRASSASGPGCPRAHRRAEGARRGDPARRRAAYTDGFGGGHGDLARTAGRGRAGARLGRGVHRRRAPTTPEAYARPCSRPCSTARASHCSIGIGDTLVRAKVATGFGKPRGVFRLTGRQLARGHGRTADDGSVGRRLQDRQALAETHGIRTVNELAATAPDQLCRRVRPADGAVVSPSSARGDGSRVVDDTPWVARGHSRETTFQQDLTEPAQVEDAVRELVARGARGRRRRGPAGHRTSTLKVRYAPFFTKTFSEEAARHRRPGRGARAGARARRQARGGARDQRCSGCAPR